MFSGEEIFEEFESASGIKTDARSGETNQKVGRSAARSFDRGEGMHIEKGASYRFAGWIPDWTRDDDKLRQVLTARSNSHDRMMAYELTAAQLRAIPLVQLLLYEKHKESIARPGGYAALQTAIAYRSWREGMHSPAVAESLGVSAPMVRQCLLRMRDVARSLGFEEDVSKHWTAGTRVKRKRKPAATQPPEKNWDRSRLALARPNPPSG
jgi:hypothetical protein